jgi:hypothetical protein
MVLRLFCGIQNFINLNHRDFQSICQKSVSSFYHMVVSTHLISLAVFKNKLKVKNKRKLLFQLLDVCQTVLYPFNY